MGIHKIKGVVQNYAWGGTDFIPNLIGIPATETKCAEYWMGAHEKAPSVLEESDEPLNRFLENEMKTTLGEAVSEKFGRLPFLFKVLDVRDMLSIQVHPSKEEAEKGFDRENELGIPLTAPYRNYKDNNHKPEIMVALGEFWLLHGFKPVEEIKSILASIPEFSHLVSVFDQGGYRALYQTVMEESIEKTNATLRPLVERIVPNYRNGSIPKTSPDYWAAKAFETFCATGDLDKGIYSIYFFNIVRAERGEAIFQAAGVPHAYMEGQNIELMANSDNVLRGGLTSKHVDVAELLKHIDFNETVPNILSGSLQPDGLEKVYSSVAPDFELTKIDLHDRATLTTRSKSAEILITMDGSVEFDSGEKQISVSKGEVVLVTADTDYSVQSAQAQLYKARCPLGDN